MDDCFFHSNLQKKSKRQRYIIVLQPGVCYNFSVVESNRLKPVEEWYEN